MKPSRDPVLMLVPCCRLRLRLHAPGQTGPLSIGVEVLDVVQGIYMVEVVKGRGASPDFYAFYSQLTEQLQVGVWPVDQTCMQRPTRQWSEEGRTPIGWPVWMTAGLACT